MYMYFRKLTISMPFAQNTYHILPPPHRRHLARSFPVPRGRTATGGRSTMPSLSMASISQPTVPSPPHTKIRAPGTSLKNCNLKKNKHFKLFIIYCHLNSHRLFQVFKINMHCHQISISTSSKSFHFGFLNNTRLSVNFKIYYYL